MLTANMAAFIAVALPTMQAIHACRRSGKRERTRIAQTAEQSGTPPFSSQEMVHLLKADRTSRHESRRDRTGTSDDRIRPAGRCQTDIGDGDVPRPGRNAASAELDRERFGDRFTKRSKETGIVYVLVSYTECFSVDRLGSRLYHIHSG
jgi:hypothetical protein